MSGSGTNSLLTPKSQQLNCEFASNKLPTLTGLTRVRTYVFCVVILNTCATQFASDVGNIAGIWRLKKIGEDDFPGVEGKSFFSSMFFFKMFAYIIFNFYMFLLFQLIILKHWVEKYLLKGLLRMNPKLQPRND